MSHRDTTVSITVSITLSHLRPTQPHPAIGPPSSASREGGTSSFPGLFALEPRSVSWSERSVASQRPRYPAGLASAHLLIRVRRARKPVSRGQWTTGGPLNRKRRPEPA